MDQTDYVIGLGIELNETVWTSTQVDQLKLDLDLELRCGRYVCVRLDVTPTIDNLNGGVTSEALREVALATIIEDGARDPDAEKTIRTTGRRIIERAGGLTDDSLEVVATAYRYGFAIGDAPTREVLTLLGLSRSKASRWIAEAREEGFLGETTERRPGAWFAVEAQRDRVGRLRSELDARRGVLAAYRVANDQAEQDLERAFGTEHEFPAQFVAENAKRTLEDQIAGLSDAQYRLAEAQRVLDSLEAQQEED